MVGLKFNVFCRKETQPNTQNHGQRIHRSKMGTVVWPKIPKMPRHFSAQFVYPSTKIWDFRKKNLSGCPSMLDTIGIDVPLLYMYIPFSPGKQLLNRRAIACVKLKSLNVHMWFKSYSYLTFWIRGYNSQSPYKWPSILCIFPFCTF